MGTTLATRPESGGRHEALPDDTEDLLTAEEWDLLFAAGEDENASAIGATMLADTAGTDESVSWKNEVTLALDLGLIAGRAASRATAKSSEPVDDAGTLTGPSTGSGRPLFDYAVFMAGRQRAYAAGATPPVVIMGSPDSVLAPDDSEGVSTDDLTRLADRIRALPPIPGDNGVARPLERNATGPAPFELQRRTPGLAHEVEMAAEVTEGDRRQYMQGVDLRSIPMGQPD